jgi:hypothetical protein
MAHSITLQTGEATVVDGDVLGRIGFAASAETGSEALKVAAKIEAVAEKTFDADENATEMVFYLAADGDAASKMTLSSAGNLTVVGTITCATSLTIGSAAMSEADLEFLDGITAGTAAASKAVVLDGSKNIATIGTIGCGAITSTGSSSFGATSFGDNNITEVGDINCDSISVDDAAVGLNIAFGGNTALNKMTLTNNLAIALDITEGGNSYMKFVTTDPASNSAEKIVLGKPLIGAIRTQTDDATIAIDLSLSNYYEVLLTAGTTISAIAFTNGTAGQRFIVRFKQSSGSAGNVVMSDTAGWDDVTLNGSAQDPIWPGGTGPTMTTGASAVDVYGFIITNDSTIDGFVIGQALA